MLGLICKKIGITRIFTTNNLFIPVSVLKIENNRVVQIKNIRIDGYDAVQVSYGRKKNNRILRSEIGHYAKSNVDVGIGLFEFRVSNINDYYLGQVINLDLFSNLKLVDVIGISKGKGFSGTVKRWNFKTQDATHGNSLSHRAPGSIGQNQSPGRVFKGKKMSGRLGNERVTIQNLKIFSIDSKRDLLLINGILPGKNGGNLIVKPSVKGYSKNGIIN
ncbi:50S ribosomal protein L3 [Candidatus Purcelliella pentastirinorum]|uniref:Large ribosomal subunit protein uL3 n=1 Tax=Candidatus Purcelliella pentastirinorum TaxID=472834 RepID=A0AAX3NAM4_9ENTR|nr:50S ribosomal protein L3 [Candidatus Purcelliella pentastirinorum]WDI78561.1 50S ribosomal protein L3 [Candidatus Purcelliella pentastirinorum]WDR80411.1 50S ribosomal protein L3 [Candidatus Purcelliella pentastirinorum]